MMQVKKTYVAVGLLLILSGCHFFKQSGHKNSSEGVSGSHAFSAQEIAEYEKKIERSKRRADALQRHREFLPVKYIVKQELKPKGLVGISSEQIDQHWELYKGYVAQVNDLLVQLASLRFEGKSHTPMYADRRRRLNFEYNGMVLHEYYFGNLAPGQHLITSGPLHDALIASFGSIETWKNDFEQAGKTRGIGWAILYADPTNGMLCNHFIQEHENGNIAGFVPILVLDVWEHAYMVDHKASGRGDYIAAFMKNINWDKVEARYNEVA